MCTPDGMTTVIDTVLEVEKETAHAITVAKDKAEQAVQQAKQVQQEQLAAEYATLTDHATKAREEATAAAEKEAESIREEGAKRAAAVQQAILAHESSIVTKITEALRASS